MDQGESAASPQQQPTNSPSAPLHQHREHRARHKHRRRHKTTSAAGGTGTDPFRSDWHELFGINGGTSAAGEASSFAPAAALPPLPTGDPRRRERPLSGQPSAHRSSSSSSSGTSSSSSSSSSESARGYHATIRRDKEGNLVIVDKAEQGGRLSQESGPRGGGDGAAPADGSKPQSRKRRKRKAADTVVVVEGDNADSGERAGQDDSDNAMYDYDPDDADALNEKARLLREEVKKLDPTTNGGLQGMPSEFQAAPIPYWVKRLNDLLLFNNGTRSRSGPLVLPIDSALSQLHSDLKEARQLLDEVKQGSDWGLLRTRPAVLYEVYGPVDESQQQPVHDDGNEGSRGEHVGDEEMSPILGSEKAASGAANQPGDGGGSVEVPVLEAAEAVGQAAVEETGTEEVKADGESSDKKTKRKKSKKSAAKGPTGVTPLLPPEEEAADEARPLLQREIPLWRRRGAAVKTLTELIAYLDDRRRLLEKKLADPVNGPWYETVGAPDSSGVDGTQRATLAPALQHAYASLMTNAILSDLFIPVSQWNGLADRAARMSAAFLSQIPKVHDQFITEEDFRPAYDFFLTRPANMLDWTYGSLVPGGSPSTGPGGRRGAASSWEEDDERRSFTVHVDYIRLHPPRSPGLLLMGQTSVETDVLLAKAGAGGRRGSRQDESFSQLLADTQRYSSLMTGEALEDTLMVAESLAATQLRRGSAQSSSEAAPSVTGVDTLQLGPTSTAALSMLSVATAQKNALVSFTPEAYLIAMLLQHYERYRLLRLNLLPHLKHRSFYEEQLVHLSQQRKRTPALDQLQTQLEMLKGKATELERAAMTAMIVLWRAVLHLRGNGVNDNGHPGHPGMPFIVSSHRAAREAALTRAANTTTAAAFAGMKETSVAGTAPAASELLRMTGENGAAPAGSVQGADGDGLQPRPQRHNVQVMDIFASDSSSSGSLALDAAAAPPQATAAPAEASIVPPDSLAVMAAGPQSSELPSAAGSILLGGGGAMTRSAGSPGDVGAEEGTVMVRSTQRAARFRFFLCRVGHLAEAPYVDGDDVLLYEPVVEGADALPAPPPVAAPLASAEAGVPGNGQQHPEQPVPELHAEEAPSERIPKDQLDCLQFFQIAVFARASAAVPPQYVGCTMPRPLTAAKVVFFNESFEIRVLREPIEIILHVIAVSDGPGKGSVVATVRLQPTLTRGYLLLPLNPPVSFMFKKRLMVRYAGTGLTGVLSASTTWTTTQGLSIAQIEKLFLSGAADPLNPEYAPLLRILRKYYVEVERNESRQPSGGKDGAESKRGRGRRDRSSGRSRSSRGGGRRESAAEAAGESRSVFGRRRSTSTNVALRRRSVSTTVKTSTANVPLRWDGTPAYNGRTEAAFQRKADFSPEMLLDLPLVVGNTHGSSRATPQSGLSLSRVWNNRLLLLRHRWLIVAGQSKALDQIEAALLRYPIPLSEHEQYDLLKSVKRELAKQVADRRKHYETDAANTNGGGDLFDETAYAEEPSSVSGLALSPLPKEVKLKLWQDRQRYMKLTRKPARHISDEEKLSQVVTIPKFSLKLVLDLEPRSQFNPRRIERPKNEDIDRELLNRRRDSRIVVHVMKANHLPERADGTPLEPFVQVGFVYENAYSRCEVGTSPTWFQSLEMPFQPLDFEEETLSMIDDDIVISVYDKVEIAMPPVTLTTGAVAHETHYRTERRLLGTLRLPFYSLHQADEARMEGVFPLATPRWLLGYDASSAARTEAALNPFGEDPTQAAASNRSVSTGPTIQLYISLWPPLQREKPKALSMNELTNLVRKLNVSVELHYLHEVVLKWAKAATSKIKSITNMNAQASSRQVEPFVNCSTGDLVLACRYLLPGGGPPPPHTVTNIFEAIRFVSLLPFVVDIMTWGDKDVWSTNVELLAMRNGDYEELALLLAHFLRYLDPGNVTYVVVGEGEIYAQTIMVLHGFEDGSQLRLIDPRTGWLSPVERPFGSILRDVHYVISHDQMWANIQLSGLPHRMSWDFADPAHWLPCFDWRKDKRVALCMPALTSIQREVLTFQPADPLKAKEIEVDLRAALKKSLLAWRNHRPPAYHRSVEAILRDLLVIAEDEKCACGSVRHPAVTATARERLAEYFGLPIDGISFGGASPGGQETDKKAKAKRKKEPKAKSNEPTAEGPEADVKAAADEKRTKKEKTRSAISGYVRQRPYIRLVGAPVTSSYSASDRHFYQILQQVFECAAHEVGTDDVSFAAGVYVKSYTGDVYAMWVFLVAICRGMEDVPDSDADQ